MAPGPDGRNAVISASNRYQPQTNAATHPAGNAVEGVPFYHVAPWPGSSDPLSRAVVTLLLVTTKA